MCSDVVLGLCFELLKSWLFLLCLLHPLWPLLPLFLWGTLLLSLPLESLLLCPLRLLLCLLMESLLLCAVRERAFPAR